MYPLGARALVIWLLCATARPSSCLSDAPLLLVVSLDGFWYKYLTLYNTPHLNALANAGVRAEFMRNSFVTKTFPNHFSIATGYYEEDHGIVGNSMYDPNMNESFGIDNAESKWWDNGRVIPIWIANMLHNSSERHSGAIMWPGSNVKIHGHLIDHLLNYDPTVSFMARVETAITWFQHPSRPANCIFFYYEEPDTTGHQFGPVSDEMRRKVEEVDTLVGHMVHRLKEAGIFDRLNIILLSDHGMAPVPSTNVINVDDIVNPEMYFQSGTSPVWNLLPVPGMEEVVYSRLKAAANQSHFTVYRAQEVPPHYHYSHHPRILAIVLVADEGWDLVTTAYIKASRSYGNHGYDNRLDSMHPLFIAHGPDFRTGYISEPFDNVDLYPLMCYLLDIPVLPSNGSLHRVVFLLSRRGPSVHLELNLWLLCVTVVLVLVSLGLLLGLLCVSRRARQLRRFLLEGGFVLDDRGTNLTADEDGHPLMEGCPT